MELSLQGRHNSVSFWIDLIYFINIDKGLILPGQDSTRSEFIPLQILLEEKQQSNLLQTKIFFGKFQEAKYFYVS